MGDSCNDLAACSSEVVRTKPSLTHIEYPGGHLEFLCQGREWALSQVSEVRYSAQCRPLRQFSPATVRASVKVPGRPPAHQNNSDEAYQIC